MISLLLLSHVHTNSLIYLILIYFMSFGYILQPCLKRIKLNCKQIKSLKYCTRSVIISSTKYCKIRLDMDFVRLVLLIIYLFIISKCINIYFLSRMAEAVFETLITHLVRHNGSVSLRSRHAGVLVRHWSATGKMDDTMRK